MKYWSCDKKWITISFIFLALMKPDGFERVSSLWPINIIFTIGQIYAIFYAIYIYLRKPISALLIAVFALGIIPMVSTVLSGNVGNIMGSHLNSWLKMITAIMIVEAYVTNNDVMVLLKGIFAASLVILFLNLVCTYVWNPSGIYSPNTRISEIAALIFYGQKNTIRDPIFLGLLAGLLMQEYRRNTIWLFVYVVFGLITLLLAESATSIVVFCAMVALLLISQKLRIRINAWICMTFVLCSWLLVAVIGQVDFLQRVIVDLLSRDMTFSGRTQIWDSAFAMFVQSPVIGNGMSVDIVYSNANNPFLTVPHAHNEVIDLAIRGGLTSVILFLSIVFNIYRRISLAANRKAANAFLIIISGFMFAGIFGELWNSSFYAVLALCCAMTGGKDAKRAR